MCEEFTHQIPYFTMAKLGLYTVVGSNNGLGLLNMFRASLSASFPVILDEFEFLRKPRICVPYLYKKLLLGNPRNFYSPLCETTALVLPSMA